MVKMIWSDSQDQMVIKGFTRTNKRSGYSCHYTWNDADELYWNDKSDSDAYFEVPEDNQFYKITLDK